VPDDATLEPVDIVTEPEVPDVDAPVDMDIDPLIPALPPLGVKIFTLPLFPAPETPLEIDTLPPANDLDSPPDRYKVAPSDDVPLLAPGPIEMSPASPDVESPLPILTIPLFPDTVFPLTIFNAPLSVPLLPAPDDISISPLLLVLDPLAPLINDILPPVLLLE
jgi:hypothetical protein